MFTFGEAAYSASSADRYEQPEGPHRMMRGGSSWSRTFKSSVRPSVWSARRVASGRRRGSLDQAVPPLKRLAGGQVEALFDELLPLESASCRRTWRCWTGWW